VQKTIAKPATCAGIGLHTGERTTVRLLPAGPDTGVVFVRADLPGRPEIPVTPENAHYDPRHGRRTILRHGDVEVHSMEHLLAAIAGLGIDNLRVEVSGLEVPEPGDGSALPFTTALRDAGIKEQGVPRRPLKVHKTIVLRSGDVELLAIPASHFRVSFTIDFAHPVVGTQYLSLEVTNGVFEQEIAPARTFVLERDIKTLKAQGLIKGGRLESAVVVGEDRILNAEPLRFPDEFVRHKVLDLIGDLALLGRPLLGHIIAVRSGHATNVAFVQHLAREMPQAAERRGEGGPAVWDSIAIQSILPHRYPFLLVDRVVETEAGKRVTGYKNVTINEPFFAGHFPGHPIMPAVLLLEAMAQTGGILLLSSLEDPSRVLVYFMGIDGAKFRRPVRPGDQLRFELTMLKFKGRICKMRGEAYVEDQLVAEADLLSSIVEKA
jgi:UDP-3-O-[3-hydroxymyristoyl] N-acetylglucosamine deacetylase/3-hydroxyacyl-[acyl-carrier-protein] dehydratase